MYNLPNITVEKLLKSKHYLKYDGVLKHIKGQSNGKDILQQSYTNVKYCISLLQKVNSFDNITEVFNILFGIDKEELMQMKVVDYYKLRNYLIETIKTINTNESKLAQGGNTDLAKWQFAGGDRLKPFDNTLPLDQLAERYKSYPFDLGKKPYSEIFYLIAMTKTLNEVNYNYTIAK